MFKLAENGIITVNAGDTFKVPLYIFFNNDEVYNVEETDRIYFSLTEPQQSFYHGVVRKELVLDKIDKDIYLEFIPEDTENLHPGTYYYEVKLQKFVEGKEYISTIIPKRKFIIL